MKKSAILIIAGLLIAGCSSKKTTDAYGNFEAVETIVSSEANGKLIDFNLAEGQEVHQGQHVATVDSTIPSLQKQELLARRRSVVSKIAGADAQTDVIGQQLKNLRVDLQRVQNMLKDDAATQKQLDDLTGSEKILRKQLKAAEAQRGSVASELEALDANLALVSEQLNRCRIFNPIDGTVLEKYSEVFEMTAAGKPLYKVADLSALVLRAYVSGGQMIRLRIGQGCTVRIDDGKEYRDFQGTIIRISDKAEFTPKIIQTKEERVNLVYAVKIQVKNEDGMIKIGMPGEVLF